MTTPQRVSVIAILVAAFGGVAIWLFTGGADAPSPRDVDQSPPSAVSDTARGGSGAAGLAGVAESGPASIKSAPFDGALDEATGERLSVTGRTTDYDEAPLGRLEVKLQVFDGYEAKGDALFERTTTSGADGAFAFALGRPGRTVTLAATVTDAELHASKVTETVIRGDPDPPPMIVRAGRFNAEITGTVSSKTGARIANASVGWARVVPTDDTGTYRYRILVRKSGPLYVHARAPGYAKKDAQLAQPRPGSTTRLDFELELEGIVAGHVRRSDGTPIAAAKVWGHAADRVETLTDATGAFRLAGFDTERDHPYIQAEADGFVSERAPQLVFTNHQATIEFVLQPGVAISGIVTGRDDAAVEGAEVRVGKPNYAGTVTTRSDAKGHFRLPAVKPGTHEVAATRRGYAETTTTVIVTDVGFDPPDLRIRLEQGRRVGGIVADAAGTPIPGVNIAVRVNGDYSSMDGTRTDPEGRFKIEALPAANVSLQLWAKGWLRADHAIREYRDDLKLVLERAGSLAGRVVDARSRAPINRFTIRIIPPQLKPGDRTGYGYSTTWSDRGHEFVDTDGYWTVEEDLTPGTVFAIEASAAGYAAAKAPRIVATPGQAPDAVVIELSPPGSVAGSAVVEATGAAVSDAAISILTAAEEQARETHAGWKPRVTGKTDAAGAFVLNEVPAGQVHLLAEHPDYPLVRVGPLLVREGERLDGIVAKFSQGASIEGTCLGLDGRPASGASVAMQLNLKMGKSKTSVSDAAGRFSFRGLGPGPHYLSVRYRGDPIDSLTQVVPVAAGETKSVVVPMQGTATLKVELESDEKVPNGLLLRLNPKLPDRVVPGQDQRPWRYRIMAGKSVELVGIPGGDYQVTVEQMSISGAGLRGEASIGIQDGQKAEVRVPLRRGG